MAGYTGDMAFLTSLPIDDIKMLFTEADIDNNGIINRQETINIFQSIFNRAGIINSPRNWNRQHGSAAHDTYQGLFPNITDNAFNITQAQFINSFIVWGNYLQTLATQNPNLRIRNYLGYELSVSQVLQQLRQAIITRDDDDAMVIASDDGSIDNSNGAAEQAPIFNPGLQYQSSSQDSELQRALAESMTTTNASNGAAEEAPYYNPELQRQSTSKDEDLQRALAASMGQMDPQSQVKAPKEVLDANCFDPEELSEEKIQDYLDKSPNNFVLTLGGDNYECWSMDSLRARWVLPGEEGNYPPKPDHLPDPYFQMFYKCKGHIIDRNRDGEPSQVFVKMSFQSTPVEKPDWVFDGPPPAPRVFRLVPTGKSEILGANNYADGWNEISDYDGSNPGGLTGADHCEGDPVPTYRLEPIIHTSQSGGKRSRRSLKKHHRTKKSRSKNKSYGLKRKFKKTKSKSKKKTHKK
jgi:hypothetical protein